MRQRMETDMWDATATVLAIRAWPNPVVDARGFAPTSAYVEWAWLPILGPGATGVYRRLATGLDASPEGYELEIDELSRSSGMGSGESCHSSIFSVTARLVAFGLARWEDKATLAVLRKAPPLASGRVRSRGAGVSAVHDWDHNAA